MSTHEPVIRNESVEPGSDRSFGLIVGGILAAIGVYLQFSGGSDLAVWLLTTGTLLVVLGAVFPLILHPLNVGWTKLGLLLGRVVTPLVMFIVYVVSVVPIGLLLRLFGKDLLGLRRGDSKESYWVQRNPRGPAPESLKDQF